MSETYEQIINEPAMVQAVSHLAVILTRLCSRAGETGVVVVDQQVGFVAEKYRVNRFNLRYAFSSIHECSAEDWYKKLSDAGQPPEVKPISKIAIKEKLMAKCLNAIDLALTDLMENHEKYADPRMRIRYTVQYTSERFDLPVAEVRTEWYRNYHESPESYFDSISPTPTNGSTYNPDDYDAYDNIYGTHWSSSVSVAPTRQELAWKRLTELITYVKTFDENQKVILKVKTFKI
jgi:hypothetical protein